MKNSSIYILFFFIALVFMIITSCELIVYHEKIHQIIYEDYGIESQIEYNWFDLWGPSGTTTAYLNSTDCPESCQMAHEINEIVGYNAISINLSLFVLLMLYLLIKVYMGLENEYKHLNIQTNIQT